MKLWAGRLTGEVDERVNALNASIGFDCRMIRADISGSIAHAEMLGSIGVLCDSDATAIIEGLEGILADIESGALEIDMTAEDVHTFVEGELTARIGEPGKRLHTARSRNDQVALDLRMYLSEAVDNISAQARTLALALCEVAEAHLESVMPGYTHLQRAQPITLAHYLMAYTQMLMRDIDRLSDCKARMLVMPLGSGALAGTTYPLDRDMVCGALGFSQISENSIDAVSDRDFVVELSGVLSMIMMHLSRFSEELVMWSSWEFGFVSLSDSFSTGSSIMPQKKNPDIPELVRGKAARVYGANMALLTMMKGLPLAYNKDLQEDKEPIFDAVDTALHCLEIMTPMLKTAAFKTAKMRAAAAHGFINATDCADYLVRNGMPFRDAYRVTGRLVNRCIELDTTLEELSIDEYKAFSELFESDIYEAIDLLTCVKNRNIPGGPAPAAVMASICSARKKLDA